MYIYLGNCFTIGNQHFNAMSETERWGMLPTALTTSKLPPGGRKFLLGIGINVYLNDSHKPLKNAINDLYAVVNILVDKYDFERENVFLLKDEQATREEIINRLDHFTDSNVLGENDSLLIYFAGHGYLDKNKRGYWVPVDSKAYNTASYIPNGLVKEKLSDMKCRHVLLISDSCFSGTLLEENRAVPAANRLADELERRKSRWIITSGRPDETVSDGRGKNSPFAEAMLYELQINQKSKLLADVLAQNVRSSTASNARQIPQTGKLFDAGDRDGQFVFTLRDPEPGVWQTALSKNTTSAFELFLIEYPKSLHADEAKERIALLFNQSIRTDGLTPEERNERYKHLSPPEQANELLNRRTQEWVTNGYVIRFLLSFSDWQFIKWHHKNITDWGPNELTKKKLLTQSTRWLRRWIGAGLAVIYIGLGFSAWWESPWGQVWQMRRTLDKLSKSGGGDESRIWAIRTFAATGEPVRALAATIGLLDESKARVIPDIAQGFIQIKDTKQAKITMTQALNTASALSNGLKVRVLPAIAMTFAQLKDKAGVGQTLTATNNLFGEDKVKVLLAIATAFAQLKDKAGVGQTLTAANDLDDEGRAQVLPAITTAFAQLKDKTGLGQTLTATNDLRGYSTIIEAKVRVLC